MNPKNICWLDVYSSMVVRFAKLKLYSFVYWFLKFNFYSSKIICTIYKFEIFTRQLVFKIVKHSTTLKIYFALAKKSLNKKFKWIAAIYCHFFALFRVILGFIIYSFSHTGNRSFRRLKFIPMIHFDRYLRKTTLKYWKH